MKIIGHRGAMGLSPENTLESIRQALKNNVDMIELDVRVQAGILVLSHDPVEKSHVYCPLSHALREIDGKVPVNLELKELKVVKLLPKALTNYTHEILFSSFKFNILHELKTTIPDANFAVLEKWSGVRGVAEASLLETKHLIMNEKWLWSSFVQSMKKQGYTLFAYIVNDKDRALELKSWGIDGIITDFPNRFNK